MADQVTFNYAAWIARYPEFTATVSEPLAQLYFSEASVYHENNGGNVFVDSEAVQLTLLNMLTAHIAARYAAGQPLAGSVIVGPVNHAAEGSVSVGAQPLPVPWTLAWFTTTKYGSDYLAATAVYRTMRYRVGPRRIFNPPFFYPGGWGP